MGGNNKKKYAVWVKPKYDPTGQAIKEWHLLFKMTSYRGMSLHLSVHLSIYVCLSVLPELRCIYSFFTDSLTFNQ